MLQNPNQQGGLSAKAASSLVEATQTAKPPSKLDQCLLALNEEINNLRDSVVGLENELSPVLSPRGTDPTPPEHEPHEVLMGIVTGSLTVAVADLTELRKRLDVVRTRLEV